MVTGLPGSGKTTLGKALARALDVSLLSLDELKERLYVERPGLDAYALRLAAENLLASRLDQLARRPGGDVVAVVDIWVAPTRDAARVRELLNGRGCTVVELVCRVSAEQAAERYAARPRTAPHLPPDAATLQRIREAAPRITSLGLGRSIDVDTSRSVDVPELLASLYPVNAARGEQTDAAAAPQGASARPD